MSAAWDCDTHGHLVTVSSTRCVECGEAVYESAAESPDVASGPVPRLSVVRDAPAVADEGSG